MQIPQTDPASLIVPLLALIVILAVDSVQEDDPIPYRLFVGAIGLGSLGPILIVLAFAIVVPEGQVEPGTVTLYTVISLSLITLLLIGTTVIETRRGLDDTDTIRWGAGLFILVTLWYGLLFYAIP